MKRPKHPCQACGKAVASELAAAGQTLCAQCQQCVELICEIPELLPQLLVAAGAGQSVEAARELPDVLDAVRYRTRDRENNTWYVSVSEMEGRPVEIFASTAFDRDHHLQSRISNLTTITRLVSLILRNVFMNEKLTLEKILTQLLRSSRQPNDLPAMLAGILGNYSQEFAQLKEKEEQSSAG